MITNLFKKKNVDITKIIWYNLIVPRDKKEKGEHTMNILVYLLIGALIGCCAGAAVYNMIEEWKDNH